MSKKNSYSELMKKSVMDRQKQSKNYMQDLFIEMVIHEACMLFELASVNTEIDKSLDSRDKELFMKLSNKKKELLQRFGT
ncbi:IDEAL domain-containing protein [Peribacillus kribbensis]|uniref:IDEAL domain-containing protein n=1 Tax=Peribacillus kribbensis TaxID=356658 RepID=UPI00047D68A0|nr:IDEAL domain-containing protein [Peribacillus kribbensis]